MELKYINGKSEILPRYVVGIDIGYSSTGICIYEFDTGSIKFLSPKIKSYLKGLNTKNLGITEYLFLSKKVRNFVLRELFKDISLQDSVAFSLEVPNIVGCYAPALTLLVNDYTSAFLHYINTYRVYFTHNRLGGFYLHKRSFSKSDIATMIQECYTDLTPSNQHERDALLQVHTVLALDYNILLSDSMRSLEGSTIKRCKL